MVPEKEIGDQRKKFDNNLKFRPLKSNTSKILQKLIRPEIEKMQY